MADTGKKPSDIQFSGFGKAPFVYFDIAPTFGIMSGAIQIELASRVLAPEGKNTVVEFIATAHLRCSPAAAVDLRNAIDQALGMLEQPAEQQHAGSDTIN